MGLEAKHLDNNAMQADIEVRRPDGACFTIEVKSLRKGSGGTWFVRDRPLKERSQFWILVHGLEPGLPDTSALTAYILSTAEMQQIWDANPWNQNKSPGQSGDVRKKMIPDSALNAWEKLLQPVG